MWDQKKLSQIQEMVKEWEKQSQSAFPAEFEGKVVNDSGIEIRGVYTPLDLERVGFDPVRDLGLPGIYPYTRGIDPLMYRVRPWDIRQYAGFATAKETNTLFKNLIQGGQTGLSLAFDLPTQLGLDPDHHLAQGEVGKTGLALKSFRDWEEVFQGIDIGRIFVNSVANAQAAVVLAMHFALAQKQEKDLRVLKGGIQNDILKEYICRGNYIFPIPAALRLISDTFVYCAEQAPEFWPVNIGAIHLSEAGANRVQQIAYALGIAMTYIDAVIRRGLPIDAFASRMTFCTCENHTDFFLEIAKLRAMRKIWAMKLKEHYGARDPRSMMLRYISQNGGTSLTKQHPEGNITRSALATLIGALSGAQQIGLRTMDEGLGIPSERAEQIAIKTQQIIAYETNIVHTADPLGGSYFMECLTKEMEEKILEEMDRVERLGGMVRAIEDGYIQRSIMQSAYEAQKKLETGATVRVGVNKFPVEEEKRRYKTYRADPLVEEQQIADLQALKKMRDNGKVEKALDELEKMARREESNETNLLPCLLSAVKAYATMGEICGRLRGVFGVFREPKVI